MDYRDVLNYIVSKGVAVVHKAEYCNGVAAGKTFVFGDVIKEGKFYKIKDINGSHIVSTYWVEYILLLKNFRETPAA